jgi:hypothetical protein
MRSGRAAEALAEFERSKRFVLTFAEVLEARLAAQPDNPLASLHMTAILRESIQRLEEDRPRGWQSGMRQALQDVVEMSRDFTSEDVRRADEFLVARGAPRLSDLRREVWRTIPKALARGRIQSESEYYLLVERLNDSADPELTEEARTKLASIVAEYEERRVRPR